jgi:hypothetical protein
MIGYKLTPEQKELLVWQYFNDNSQFNPIQDVNGEWFIFDKEVEECTNANFQWVKDLPQENYIAPIVANPFM